MQLQDITLEAIDHQLSKRLGLEIEQRIKELRGRDYISDVIFRASGIGDVITKITGMNVSIHTTSGYKAYMHVPDVNRNNPMLEQYRRNYFKNKDSASFLRTRGRMEGTVDFSNGYVTGDLSKVKMSMTVGSGLLTNGSAATAAETTAVILHEIGHMFVYLEMLGRVTRTNYYMEEGTRRLLAADDKTQRIVILKELTDEFNTTIPDAKRYAEQRRGADSYRVMILNMAVEESRQQLNVNIYDTRAYEQLADLYAARQGYARPLAVMLDKMYRASDDPAYFPPAVNATYRILILVSFLLMTVGMYGIPILLLLLLGNPLKVTHEPVPKRIAKLRTQINDALKVKVSKTRRAELLYDLAVIKEIESNMSDNIGIVEWLWTNVWPTGREQADAIAVQEKLESMLNNDLYGTAATIQAEIDK